MSQSQTADPFLDKLRLALDRMPLPQEQPLRYVVALSGGIDSTVLLAALSRLEPRPPLAALHIDHGLHEDSSRWSEHCEEFARSLGVDFYTQRVTVAHDSGLGFEGAAREARYAALARMIGPADVLLTAHHGDDQLETVLLRLLRGAGVKGLAAIVEFGRLGEGFLARPLLDFMRAEIRAQAERWQLIWIEDPSNEDLQHDRNFLRATLLPTLTQRWSAAVRSASRLARHMHEADQLMMEMAMLDLGSEVDVQRVPRDVLRALSPHRQRNVLRYLIHSCSLPLPSTAQLQELSASLSVTRPDAHTLVSWPGARARVYRDHLYLLAPLGSKSDLVAGARLALDNSWSGSEGRLSFRQAEGQGLPDRWVKDGVEIRFRCGGEDFKPLNRGHSKPLKWWFQEAGVVPWMRDRIPLLYRQEMLVAVGDLWVNDEVRAESAETPRWRVSWTDHPPIN